MGEGMIFTDVELQEAINEAKEVVSLGQEKIESDPSAEYNANLKQGADSKGTNFKAEDGR
jgi:hypothetical protein